ncbi:Aste57867_18524 [Aphanomyces stellatus]|uniref:Aste57867_18524 protein n=1 Tax=Aphanomyces stellatus TaxID=120398 RepID=A0A485LAX3_9STRA|nr:hypothetical protein As57867_018462 [Aphanomyces stellatus]VFT95260.1 Aste57867_18524 [Aphanomyces stellatus]
MKAELRWLLTCLCLAAIDASPTVDHFLSVVGGLDFCDGGCLDDLPGEVPSHHRRLVASTNVLLFRSVSGYGFRNQSNALVLPQSTPEQCASICNVDLACLSFDMEANTCYISHTDRYAFPADYLPRLGSTYYEWQGQFEQEFLIQGPTFVPNGGTFLTHASVRLFTQTRAASIYYAITAANGTVVTPFALLPPAASIVLPEFDCTIQAYAAKTGLNKSVTSVSLVYNIHPAKYMYLVPFYDGNNFHGKLTRVKLDVQGVKRPRPSLVLEFTDLNTFFGIGPFANQLQVLNLSAIDPRLAGFYDGFTVVTTTTYVNVSLETFHNRSKWALVDSAMYLVNPANTIFNDSVPVIEEILYLSPFMNNQGYSGVIAKIYLRAFDAMIPNSKLPSFLPAAVETLDLTTVDPTLTGFVSCFTYNNFGYFVQRVNANGLGGKIVRVDLSQFHNGGAIRVLDLSLIDARLVGFGGGFVYDHYAYLVPLDRNKVGLELNPNYKYFPTPTSSLMVQLDLNDFASTQIIDLSILDPKYACGYFGGPNLEVNSFAYFVPYMWTADTISPTVNPYHGLVVRMNLLTLALETLDLTLVDPSLKGFMRGYAYGKYAIMVPHRNGQNNLVQRRLNPSQKTNFGKIVRIDTDNFQPAFVDVLDLTIALRTQIPNLPDVDLRGFLGGGASGEYGFFVPYFNGVRFSGKVVRVNLKTWNEVQVLDMTQVDDNLRGFTGGIMSAMTQPLDTDMWHWIIPEGSRTPYSYVVPETDNLVYS